MSASPIVQERGTLANLFFSFLPILLIILFWVWIFRRQAKNMGGMMGSKKVKPVEAEDVRVNFDDVAGIDEVKSELQQVVSFLKEPERYTKLGAKLPKGVLLEGQPGTGKTLIARATAGEAGVPFFSASASEFIEMIVGVGASRVRELFTEARKVAPAIIFIDEIDTIGRARSSSRAMGSNSEQEQTLNQILTELDGFTGAEGVVVIAATNRSDVLDPALTRAGRFDRKITVSAPDAGGREQILKVHTRNKPLAQDVDLMAVAKTTPGMTGADLANLANEAAILAAKSVLPRSHPATSLLPWRRSSSVANVRLSCRKRRSYGPPTTRQATHSSACFNRARIRFARSRSSRAAAPSALPCRHRNRIATVTTSTTSKAGSLAPWAAWPPNSKSLVS